MKQINLLPYKEQTRQMTSALAVAGLWGVVIALMAVAGLYGSVRSITALGAERQSASQNTSVTAQIDPTLVDRVTVLNSLASAEVDWDKAFVIVSRLVPEGVSLSAYSYADSGNGLTLKLSGSAVSNVVFAAFADSLQADSSISSLKIDSYTYQADDGSVAFSLSVEVPRESVGYQPSSND